MSKIENFFASRATTSFLRRTLLSGYKELQGINSCQTELTKSFAPHILATEFCFTVHLKIITHQTLQDSYKLNCNIGKTNENKLD